MKLILFVFLCKSNKKFLLTSTKNIFKYYLFYIYVR